MSLKISSDRPVSTGEALAMILPSAPAALPKPDAEGGGKLLPAPAATTVSLQPHATAVEAPGNRSTQPIADATAASTERASFKKAARHEGAKPRRAPVEAAVQRKPGSGWSDERRAKFRATMARKFGKDPHEARPRHSNGAATPVNPHLLGGAARIRHEERPTPPEVAA